MEMVYGGIASMALATWAGKSMRLSDVQTICMICMAGVGCCITGLAYLWIADIITGESGSIMWFVTGIIGGLMGIAVYCIQLYTPQFIKLLKDNSLI